MGAFDAFVRICHTIALGILFAGFPGWVIYGSAGAAASMQDIDCTSPFFNDVATTRQGSLGLFLVSIFVLAMVATFDREYTIGPKKKHLLLLAGFGGFVISGIMAIEVLLAGSCTVDAANVADPVGDEDIQVVASLALVIATALGFLHFDFRKNDEGKIRPSMPSVSTFINLVVRIMLSIAFLSMLANEGDALHRKFIDADRFNSAGCIASRALFAVDEGVLYETFYKPIRLVDTESHISLTGQLTKAPANEAMLGTIAATLGAGIVELFGLVASNHMARRDLDSSEASTINLICKFLMWFQFITLGIASTSMLLANEMIACPLFNIGNEIIRWIFVSIALFYCFASLHVISFVADSAWTKPIAHEDDAGNSKDDGEPLMSHILPADDE